MLRVHYAIELLPFLSIALLLTIFAALLFLFEPVWLFHHSDFKVGKQIISRVEAFRASHGHLPDNLKDVGMTEDDLSVYYRKDGDTHYIIWFGTTLGESETYDSDTKRWN